MFRTFGVLVIFSPLLLSCSSNPTGDVGFNVALNFSYGSDPLIALIDTVSVVVSAADAGQLFDSSFAAVLGSSGTLSIYMNIDPGPGRYFKISLKDSGARVLFSSRRELDIPSNRHLSLDLSISQSGFGTASTVKIFRDLLPWDSHALDSAMTGMGFSIGAGEYSYDVYASTQMGIVEMQPGIDLIIISNDQPQSFYDNYFVHSERFERFAAEGGALLWCACDMGWNYGSIADAGITLPGSVNITYSLDQVNLVSNSDFQVLGDLPDTLSGNYASQEVFSGLPGGALVYITDFDGAPSLVGFAIGEGWVILSGQPLEYNYDRRDTYNIGLLLPQLIRFLLGMGPGEVVLHSPGPAGL